jgi:hypothetical protein
MPFFDNQRGQAVPRKAKKDEPQDLLQPCDPLSLYEFAVKYLDYAKSSDRQRV